MSPNLRNTGVIDKWLQLAELAKLFGLSEGSIRRPAKKKWFSSAPLDTLCRAGSFGVGAGALD